MTLEKTKSRLPPATPEKAINYLFNPGIVVTPVVPVTWRLRQEDGMNPGTP
jgi:hypothetical protein